MKPAGFEDTIAAISTAAGEGGIGIVRLSGPSALVAADKIFRANAGIRPSEQKPFTVQYGHVVDIWDSAEARIDEALILVMHSPKSYTRENMAEISCHGGQAVMQRVLAACLGAGARAAEPGEFTRRAFLNGRIDLSQAEAVLGLIQSKTARAADASRRQLEGSVSNLVRRTRDDLAHILSHAEASIDFPDDRIEPMARAETQTRLTATLQSLERIDRQARSGVFVSSGVRAALAGLPNVGKSSLMNALVKKNRVIVSPIPGTTRDTVEEEIQIGGFPIRLVDTAGLQDAACGIEKQGIERSHRELEKSDLVLFVMDGSRAILSEEEALWDTIGAGKGRILVVNKSDLRPPDSGELFGGRFASATAIVHTSCETGAGLDVLEREIARFADADSPSKSEEAWITSVRHLELFRRAASHTRDALTAIDGGLPAEFLVSDIRLAMDSLGEIIGEVVTDDILDLIFNQFCIGK